MASTPSPAGERRIEGKPRVFVTRHLPGVEQRFSELFDATLNTGDSALGRDAIAAAMQSAHVLVPTVTDRIDADLIDNAGDQLGLIANFGAGVDHIDLVAARRRKIMVTNTPGVFTEDTADITMALILGATRRLSEGSQMVREGDWQGWTPSFLLGASLSGKVLGIIGMGRIGQAVAHRAKAFGMDIVYHNRNRLPAAVENMLGARHEADLEELLKSANVVTLHCPATAQTQGLISRERIAMMRPDAFIINTARGELVDEAAMLDALESGHLGGAGLDVYSHEPEVDPRLASLPNVVALPHLGSATREGRQAAGEKVIANIRFWADGHRPPDQVLTGLF
jgi:glyoxylate reductase